MNNQLNFRYDTTKQWFKGNTHIHSTCSDGGLTHVQLAELYTQAGYHFLFATDHFQPSNFNHNHSNGSLLWLNGVELDGKDPRGASYHVICLGTFSGITPLTPFGEAMVTAREQGALFILAHPFWCGNSFEDVYNVGIRWGRVL